MQNQIAKLVKLKFSEKLNQLNITFVKIKAPIKKRIRLYINKIKKYWEKTKIVFIIVEILLPDEKYTAKYYIYSFL